MHCLWLSPCLHVDLSLRLLLVGVGLIILGVKQTSEFLQSSPWLTQIPFLLRLISLCSLFFALCFFFTILLSWLYDWIFLASVSVKFCCDTTAFLVDGICGIGISGTEQHTNHRILITMAISVQVSNMILTKQYRCIHSSSCACTKGHLTEEIIFLVFNHLNWNPKLIVALSCACKWFDDLAKRVLWKEFCKTRAPKMMLDMQSSGSHSVDGNWRALGKLLIYCSGSRKDGLFSSSHIPGHFVYRTRFSRTSGKSFLLPQCRTDVLYVSDPCEHLDQGDDGDVGFFRGIFKSFATSKVRKLLIKRCAPLHPTEMCPYCKARLWNMLAAKMIPSSASCRLGAYDDCIEYYVCLNGHVLGICTLLPLSDTDEASEE